MAQQKSPHHVGVSEMVVFAYHLPAYFSRYRNEESRHLMIRTKKGVDAKKVSLKNRKARKEQDLEMGRN